MRWKQGALFLIALSGTADRLSAQRTAYEELQAFSGVLSHVRLNYVDSVDLGSLLQASVRGMLSSLDPHSQYVTRREFLLREQWDRGELATPGLRLENSSAGIIVLSVAGPAARAGIQAGDRLVQLNDTTISGTSAQALELKLLGEKGSRVRLTFERGNPLSPDTLSLTLKRQAIEPAVVSEPRLIGPQTALLRLTEFTPAAGKALRKGIETARDQGAKQLILDLRGNPGGDLGSMIEIASLFLPRQTELFRIQGRRQSLHDRAITSEDGKFAKLPLILLIDAGSASAAEILAGSLQDHDRALVMGRRSFGKALVQSSLPLPNADVVLLTTGRIVTPSGRLIQRRYSGIPTAEYLQQAGQIGPSAGDTAGVHRTAAGREVRGGGGILPDVVLPEPAPLPLWFTIASDSGYDDAADRHANVLPAEPSSRAAWMGDTLAWDAQLVTPFLERVKIGLGISVAPSRDLRRRLGLMLAQRTAFAKWGAAAAEDLSIRYDPDIQAAVARFPRITESLRPAGRR